MGLIPFLPQPAGQVHNPIVKLDISFNLLQKFFDPCYSCMTVTEAHDGGFVGLLEFVFCTVQIIEVMI